MVIAGLFALAAAAVLIFDLLGVAERSEWHSLGLAGEIRSPHPQPYRVDDREFYLVWVDSAPIALSTTDPHKGVCHIRWFEQERFFADPCGGTVYLSDGSYHHGPSPRSMDQFAVRMAGGRVEVNVYRVTPGRNHT
jgi:hypothetical protein